MGAGFFKLNEHRGGCCQLGRGEEGNSSNRAELGAACLALEMHGNPDADIMRDIIQLLRERIEQGLLIIFIKIKAHHGDPLNEQADRWADEADKARIFAGLSHQTDQSSTVRTMG